MNYLIILFQVILANYNLSDVEIDFVYIDTTQQENKNFQDLSNDSLPMYFKDDDFFFGFLINYPNDSCFEYYTKIFFPTKPKSFGGNLLDRNYNESENFIITKTYKTKGLTFTNFNFTRGDPCGNYTFELYINNNLRCRKQIIVYEPY